MKKKKNWRKVSTQITVINQHTVGIKRKID